MLLDISNRFIATTKLFLIIVKEIERDIFTLCHSDQSTKMPLIAITQKMIIITPVQFFSDPFSNNLLCSIVDQSRAGGSSEDLQNIESFLECMFVFLQIQKFH